MSGASPTGNPDNWSDERLKENIHIIGKTADGIPIKKFNYKSDPDKTTLIGLVAQDVEKKRPEAVTTHPSGFKSVNYDLATRSSLSSALGVA